MKAKTSSRYLSLIHIFGRIIYKRYKKEIPVDDAQKALCEQIDKRMEQIEAERLKLLGDPTKLKILNILSKAPSYQTELARQLSLSVPTVNHHLNALLQKGMVQAQADLESKRVWYSIHPETVRNVLEETKRHLNL